jgi:yeast amino acid transporter
MCNPRGPCPVPANRRSYWHDPGAFRNGFKGFCTVFVTAAFAFGGTELAGLAAAEAANPGKSLPRATKQVFWRVFLFYILNTFIVGLIVPSDSDFLLGSSGGNTKASPFVVAIQMAGIKGLPSVMNAVITIAVLSVANSCTFGSTRTFQALAAQGMAPKFLAYVDRRGRPLTTVALQLAFALLAFINEAHVGTQFFNWLLALSGIQYFFTWGSICFAHIRFRRAWAYHGRSLDELPFRAAFGVWGSWVGFLLNVLCLIAQFYVAVWPVGASPDAKAFFETYLTAPLILALYLFWKVYSATSKNPKINYRGWRLYVRTSETDVLSGIRDGCLIDPVEGRRIREERARRPLTAKIAEVPLGMWHALVN